MELSFEIVFQFSQNSICFYDLGFLEVYTFTCGSLSHPEHSGRDNISTKNISESTRQLSVIFAQQLKDLKYCSFLKKNNCIHDLYTLEINKKIFISLIALRKVT